MNDQQRVTLNNERLLKIYRPMRPKVVAIIIDLMGHGWHPLIDSLVFRTRGEQEQLYREGKSKLLWGFHNATNKDGSPGSLAADITDMRFPFEEPLSFKLMLAAAAAGHGLMTGIEFGLSGQERKAVQEAILSRDFTINSLSIGWDPWHVQPANLSVAAARNGERPAWNV